MGEDKGGGGHGMFPPIPAFPHKGGRDYVRGEGSNVFFLVEGKTPEDRVEG